MPYYGPGGSSGLSASADETITGIWTFSNALQFNSPRGFLVNGKIVPSVATSDLTVAIKGLDGNDPSSTNPVYCRIGDTIRSITSALSVTLNDGTNWFDSGSAELATEEIDYFVYLGYNATDGVVVGFSRIPYAKEYGDFSATSTNEKYAGISDISNAASGDDYELIGRFAATLSAGAGYTWTVPTFSNKNLIQFPIFNTRWLEYNPTPSWDGTSPSTVSANRARYKIDHETMFLTVTVEYTSAGTGNTVVTTELPMNEADTFYSNGIHGWYTDRDGAGYNTNPSCTQQTRGGVVRIEGTSLNADTVVFGGAVPLKNG